MLKLHPPILLRKKNDLTNISIGFGFAEAFRFKTDEHNRNHDFRFLISFAYIQKIYHPFYLNLGLEYSKKDLDGLDNSFNISFLPSFGGTAFKEKLTYFAEIGPNIVAIHYPENKEIQFTPGLTLGFRIQYNLTKKYSAGLSVKHINYFNMWSDHYFIVHSNLYFAIKI